MLTIQNFSVFYKHSFIYINVNILPFAFNTYSRQLVVFFNLSDLCAGEDHQKYLDVVMLIVITLPSSTDPVHLAGTASRPVRIPTRPPKSEPRSKIRKL
jgi:hypothetical protein